MPEFWTYSLADFLLFAPRTYYRLLELYNAEIVPLQAVGIVLGIGILQLTRGTHPRRYSAALGLLALLWLWVAVAFFWRHYTTINWAAPWFAGAFALEAALLALYVFVLPRRADHREERVRWHVGSILLVLALVGWPLLGAMVGRVPQSLEVFGVAPDPTAVGTLGALVALPAGPRRLLSIVPFLWCLVSAATLWTMGSPEAWALITVLAAFALAVGMPARPR